MPRSGSTKLCASGACMFFLFGCGGVGGQVVWHRISLIGRRWDAVFKKRRQSKTLQMPGVAMFASSKVRRSFSQNAALTQRRLVHFTSLCIGSAGRP